MMPQKPSSDASKQKPSSSVSSKQASSSSSSSKETSKEKSKKPFSGRYHLNSIWSLWYGVFTTAFTAYLVYIGVKRFLLCAALPWPGGEQPYIELNAHVGLVGASVVVMPFFIIASILKVGNLPNDGFKLGSTLSTCSRDPPGILQPSTGVIRNLWLHGVPTAPFLHLVAAFCLLLPRTLMDAALINAGFVPKADIWQTELDVFVRHGERFNLTPKTEIVTSAAPTIDDILDAIQSRGRYINNSEDKDPLRSPGAVNQHLSRGGKSAKIQFPSSEFYTEPYSAEAVRARKRNKTELKLLPSYYPNPKPLPTEQSRNNNLNSKSSKSDSRSSTIYNPEHSYWVPFSPEFLNYVIALLVFAVRYPSVFWHTNKKFSFLFSLHLVVSGIQIVFTFSAFRILYQLISNNPKQELEHFDYFILNKISVLILSILAILTVNVSSSAIYFYGYQRFATFLVRSRRRFHITYENEPATARPHTAQVGAFAVLMCLGISYGPILWDLFTVYKGSSNTIVLASMIATAVYVMLWVMLWLYFSVKSSWVFKLRVTVARAFVSSARSIKLVNDVEMSRVSNDDSATPILVVGGGKAVAIRDSAPQRAIMSVVNKTRDEKKSKGNEEEIYWLRPTLPDAKELKAVPKSSMLKARVTFNDYVEENHPGRKRGRNSDRQQSLPLMESDDEAGDYAILKDANYMQEDDSGSSRQSDSDVISQTSPRFEDARYVDRNQIIAYQRAREMNSGGSNDSSPVLVAPDYEDTDQVNELDQSPHAIMSRHQMFIESQGGSLTPRSTRSNDSGIPAETPSQRSDSVSSSSSQTPQENSEESGIHLGTADGSKTQSNSFDNLSQLPRDTQQMTYQPCLPAVHELPFVNTSNSVYGYCRKNSSNSDSTVAIRRQRNLTQEIKPGESIYGTRKLSSFSDASVQSESPALSFHSSGSSSGFHSANVSGSESPVPPMPLLPSAEDNGMGPSSIYSTRALHSSRPSFNRINLQHQESPYGQRPTSIQSSIKYPQAPQIPLPPIPQGMVPTMMDNMRNHHSDIYGRTNGLQQQVYPSIVGSNSIYGPARNIAIGRSSSLRYPSNSAVPKQYTNTLPHVLPKESCYNTNV